MDSPIPAPLVPRRRAAAARPSPADCRLLARASGRPGGAAAGGDMEGKDDETACKYELDFEGPAI